MMKKKKLVPEIIAVTSIFVLFFSLAQFANANASTILPIDEPFNSAVPAPRVELGWEVGQWHARPEQISHYLERLAASSDRATIDIIGRTFEQRPLLQMIITSPENHSRLEQLRELHLTAKGEGPLVISLGYSIHGNESSGSNAAMLLAYHLIAGDAQWVKDLLKDTIVIIDPMMNPDGLNRAANWFNMHRGEQPVANTLRRVEPWPNGRFNHYWFDMNRDWFAATQAETVARLQQYHLWRPHVFGDFHEHGALSYFFEPKGKKYSHPLFSQENARLTTLLGQYHAKALDKIGQNYFTREIYGDYYLGLGASYPDVNGGIGILFEQPSSTGGTMDGDNGTFTFTEGVRNHYATSISTLRGARKHKQEFLDYQQDFFTQAEKRARKQKTRAWVFADDGDPARARELVEALQLHQIEVLPLAKDVKTGDHIFKAGHAWVVPARQMQSLLIEGLFEQRKAFDRNTFYDASAWTLPLAFNLPFAELTSLPKVLQPSQNLQLTEVNRFNPLESAVAYSFSGRGVAASAMAIQLLSNDVPVYRVGDPDLIMAPESIVKKGDFIIPLATNETLTKQRRQHIEHQLTEQTRRWEVRVNGLQTGLNMAGPDLGSPNLVPLKEVKPLLLTGQGVDPQEAGHIWHLLDQRLGLGLPMLDVHHQHNFNLSDFTHLLIPDIDPIAIPKAWYPRIKQWVMAGGVLVTQKRSALWAEAVFSERGDEVTKEISEETRIDGLVKAISDKKDTSAIEQGRQPYAQHRHDAADRTLGGAIFDASLDLTHPLAQGYAREALPVYLNSLTKLQPSKNAYSTPLVLDSTKPLSGFASGIVSEQLENQILMVADKWGEGLIVKFGFNPNFRAFWRGTEGLYINALLNPPLVQGTVLPVLSSPQK